MTEQFRNFDAPKAPQAVRIEWERVLKDDDSADRPDQMQDGFWPSQDPEDAGYVEPDKFEEAQELAQTRMAEFDAGDWGYVGVIARAHIAVPIGGGSFCTYTLDSPGLWGVESDSPEYLAEVFEEQKAELLEHLKTMGEHFAPFPEPVTSQLRYGVMFARGVVKNWERGDLAGAVNGLDGWADDTEALFPDLDFVDDEGDDAEDDEPEA